MASWLRQQRILENFLVIWFDPNMDPSDAKFDYSMHQLQRIACSIETFTDIDDCIDYLTDFKDEKIFMIISGNFDRQLVQNIHNIPQLYMIYLLDDQKTSYEHWMKGTPKVQGVFNEMESLCQILRQHLKDIDRELVPINVVSASSFTSSSELDPSFMYSQLLKEVLLKKEYNEKDKTEFIEFCLIQYVERESAQKLIDEFEQNYNPSVAIWWYTRETFIYPMLNAALRTNKIEVMIKMGFFIRDLHRQIEDMYLNSKHQLQMTNVYRGQGMSNADFDKIHNNQGGLLSFNNFLSTTFDQENAYVRAASAPDDPELTGVLFQIQIDPSISTTPFASIGNVSYFKDTEQEVLFSMHTIFRIGQMEQVANRLWHVMLTSTSEEDEQLKKLRDCTRHEIETQPDWAQLVNIMLKMGEFDKAEAIYQAIETSTSMNDLELNAYCHNNIGHVMIEQGDQNRALCHLQKALQIKEHLYPSDHPSLVSTYNNIGLLYDSMGQYSAALFHYEKALRIQEKIQASDLPKLAMIHNNIGYLYHTMENYSKAVCHLRQALEMREKFLPPIHPDLAMTHNNLGEIYRARGEYAMAFVHFEKTLMIQQKSLLPRHRNMGTTYNNIGFLHLSLGHYSDALSNLEKALEIWQETLPPGHHDLAVVQNNIGMSHYSLGNHPTALSYFRQALQIQQKSLPGDHPNLAITHNHIGSIYHLMKDNAAALLHLEKALKIQEEYPTTNHTELAKTHSNIAAVHLSKNEYSSALSHMEKALALQEQWLPSNHPDLACVHNNLGVLYLQLGKHEMALSHLKHAVEIQQSSFLFNKCDLAYSYQNLGSLHLWMEQSSTALVYLEQALEIWQESLPANHPNLMACHMHLAAAYWSLDRFEESLRHAFETMRIFTCTRSSSRSQIIALEDELD